jgi:hypothetical protein
MPAASSIMVRPVFWLVHVREPADAGWRGGRSGLLFQTVGSFINYRIQMKVPGARATQVLRMPNR